MSFCARAACAAISFLAVCSARADEIWLQNGDLISGELVRLEAGKLTVRTAYAGELKLDWRQVQTLSTERPVYVTLDDETHTQGVLSAAGAGMALLAGPDSPEGRAIELSHVSALGLEPGSEVKISGHVNVGGSSTGGNTDTRQLNADAETTVRWRKNRVVAGGQVAQAEEGGQKTQSSYLAYLKYDRFVSKRWYANSNASGEHDLFKDIRLRTTLGAGTGYQFLDTPRGALSAEMGVNYVTTDFRAAPDEDYPALRWALNFEHNVFGSQARFFHRNETYVGLDAVKQSFVRTQTGLRWPIIARLNATIQYNYDWESHPAPGRVRGDRALLFTFGYAW
ncbi:MAG TPA: DUF481 domain-containing protein [Burkholderiales bacterium]|nr:DUF481 domain-containing protein [Burkholderiales bacterium]